MPRRNWKGWSITKCFKAAWAFWIIAFIITVYKWIESIAELHFGKTITFSVLFFAVLIAAFLIDAYWKYYNSD